MAKDIESLKKSEDSKKQIVEKYGFVPRSLLFIPKNPDLSGLEKKDYDTIRQLKVKYSCVPISMVYINYSWGKHVIEFEERKQHRVAKRKHKNMKYNEISYEMQNGEIKTFNQELERFSMSSQNVRGKNGGLSTMPPMLVNFVVTFYSEVGDTILDVCAGHNSRMQIIHECKRNFIGYDVSKIFMKFNEEVKNKLLGSEQNLLYKSQNTIELRLQSSEHLIEADNSIDLVFTSPPYYRQEDYGNEDDQLSKSKTYEDFLLRIEQIIKECLRVLKPGKFCVFNVDDFRNKNIFYPFHADIMRIYQKVGFKLFDVGIVPWRGSIRACFASEIERDKTLAKSHEYIIIGKKE